MFAKVFNTAKRILSRSPSVQDLRSESREDTPRSHEPDPDGAMVTTRRGTETPGTETTPRSSVKKGRGKRELEAENTPTVNKKRRKSVDKEEQTTKEASSQEPAGESEDISDTIEVAIPSQRNEETQALIKDENLPIRRRESPQVVVFSKKFAPSSPTDQLKTEAAKGEMLASTEETGLYTPAAKRTSSPDATTNIQKDDEGSPTPKAKVTEKRTSTSARKPAKRNKKSKKGDLPAQNNLPLEESNGLDEIPSSTWESEQAPIISQESASDASKKAHLRFGSKEPAETQTYITMNNQGHSRYDPPKKSVDDDNDEGDGSDSDEAPEVVTTASAASKVRAAEADAARAHQAQQEKRERKREERAKRIAEEQAEKRKREEKKARKLAKLQAKQERGEASRSNLGVDINNLPALLPDSILEAAGDKRPPTLPLVRAGKSAEELRKEKMNRHIKFLEQGQKPIKDVKKGSLNVSVLAPQNPYLPPKVNKDTRGIREHWLKGRQIEKKHKNGKRKMEFRKVERRQAGGGFLRNED